MEDGDKVLQQHIGHNWSDLVIGRLLHVAVNDLFLLESLEHFVAGLGGLQRLVGEIALVAVEDAPIIGVGRQSIHLFKLQVLSRGLVIVDDIVSTGVTEYLGQVVFATHSMPVAVVHLTAGDSGTALDLGGLLFQFVITALDSGENLGGLFFLADEHTDELNPLGLSQRVKFFIAQVGYQRDADFLDGIIAAALGRRDENHVGIGSHDHLGVKLALHTNLDDAAVFHARLDVLVKEILGAGDALYHIMGIKDSEIG